MLVHMRGGRTLNPGDVAEFEESEARRLYAARFALPADVVETAEALPAPEVMEAVPVAEQAVVRTKREYRKRR